MDWPAGVRVRLVFALPPPAVSNSVNDGQIVLSPDRSSARNCFAGVATTADGQRSQLTFAHKKCYVYTVNAFTDTLATAATE